MGGQVLWHLKMVFSSLLFLLIFLPLTLVIYRGAPARAKNWVLLGASLVFYAWGAPRFVFVLIVSCLLDYYFGQKLVPSVPLRHRQAWLALCLVYNLGLLGYFKYANFMVEQGNRFLELFQLHPLVWTTVVLPIGISFFTFHKISYLVDVYRGTVPPARGLRDYILYIVLFPQLIAGPIIRYHDVARQLTDRDHPASRMFEGIWRFAIGMAKKVLIANPLAGIADGAFGTPVTGLDPGTAWVGLLAYAFQIYFDFSGYSDMAIGLGRMFGFEFLENFNRPYTAHNFTDFWRRWHISLSNFMKEYLYVPLGGNRVGWFRGSMNLWLVFIVSGFWHGASWSFILWGCYHGFFLSLDKLIGTSRLARIPGWLAVPVTFLLVCGGWVLFRAETLSHAGHYFAALAGAHGSLGWPNGIASRSTWVLALAPLCVWGPAGWARLTIHAPVGGSFGRWNAPLRYGFAWLLLVLSAAALATGQFNPFIYFRF